MGRLASRPAHAAVHACPPQLTPQKDILLYLAKHQVPYEFIEPHDIADVVPEIDIWYSTRDQREYNSDDDEEQDIDHMRDCFVFRNEYLRRLKSGAIVMHPLPINEDPDDPPPEIDRELIPLAISGDPRLPFCQTSQRHIATRAALLDLIFASLDETAAAS